MNSFAFLLFLSVVGSEAEAREEADELRVSSFNIRFGTANDGPDHWDHRADLVVQVFQDQMPDIAGLQEALKFQIDAILEALPLYRSVGVGRDDGRDAGEFSNILYRADRFAVIDSGTFWLSDTPEEPGSSSWGNRIPRICSWVRLREQETGALLDVYNAHLDHESAPSRFRSVEAIGKHIAERSEPAPVIFMGDFNAGESSDPLRFLRGEIEGPTGIQPPDPGLVDTFRVKHPEAEDIGTFHGFTGQPGAQKIDYIMIVPGSFEVLDAEILRTNLEGRYPSDHFPINALLRRP
ncbi:endonuclease/exonuclease/phosphatase family protein [soil metagenome]